MRTELFWVQGAWPGRLAILPRPRGGDWLEDEVHAWRQAGVDAVVSLLTREEIADLDLAREEELCRTSNMQFLSFPITDRSVPASREATFDLVAKLAENLVEGKNIAIHCRQGIGRAALIAVCVLIVLGMAPETAIQQVSTARGCSVPETPEQRQWIAEFARMPVKAGQRLLNEQVEK